AGAALRWTECDLPPEVVRERMRGRSERGDSLSDATWEIHLRQRQERDAHRRPDLQSYLLVDMRQELAASSRRATDWLRQREAGEARPRRPPGILQCRPRAPAPARPGRAGP